MRQEADRDAGPHRYLDLVSRATAAAGVPVIASLNGVTAGGWTDYAAAIQEAGAAAIELNVYYLPADPRMPGRDVEQRYVDILTTVKAAVSIPVAVKLAPFFSSAGEVAVRLDRAGADGLVVFNRFMQTDIDPDTLTVSTGLTLSHPAEAALPRSWIARLRGLVGASLAASTGVETAADVAAYLLAGADVVMTTSSLLRHGPGHAAARYQCSYGLAPAYRDLLAGHGLVFSGEDDGGEVRIAELPGHPFFLATLFQPELAAEPRPHPIICAFAAAAAGHARRAQGSPPVPATRP